MKCIWNPFTSFLNQQLQISKTITIYLKSWVHSISCQVSCVTARKLMIKYITWGHPDKQKIVNACMNHNLTMSLSVRQLPKLALCDSSKGSTAWRSIEISRCVIKESTTKWSKRCWQSLKSTPKLHSQTILLWINWTLSFIITVCHQISHMLLRHCLGYSAGSSKVNTQPTEANVTTFSESEKFST